MTQIDGLDLPEAEHEIEAAHKGWHVWHSMDGGEPAREYATYTAADGSATTVDAPSVNRIEEAIGQWEWERGRTTGRAA